MADAIQGFGSLKLACICSPTPSLLRPCARDASTHLPPTNMRPMPAGTASIRLENWPESLCDAQAQVKLKPFSPGSFSCLARALAGLGRESEAAHAQHLSDLLELLESDPSNEAIKQRIGRSFAATLVLPDLCDDDQRQVRREDFEDSQVRQCPCRSVEFAPVSYSRSTSTLEHQLAEWTAARTSKRVFQGGSMQVGCADDRRAL